LKPENVEIEDIFRIIRVNKWNLDSSVTESELERGVPPPCATVQNRSLADAG
jgi:hypothetical protein